MKKKLCALFICVGLFILMTAAAVAADDVRYPEDFTDGKYQPRNAVSLFTLDMGMTVREAVDAKQIPLASAERLKLIEFPSALNLDADDVVVTDGKIAVTIDYGKADLEELMTQIIAYPMIRFRFGLDRPDDSYDTCAGFSGGIDDLKLDYVLGLMEESEIGNAFHNNHTQHSNGEIIGTIIPERSLLSPGQSGAGQHLVCWLDKENRDARRYEYYCVEYVIRNEQAMDVPFRFVPRDMISAGSLPSAVSLKSIDDGDITFVINETGQDCDVPIVLKSPVNEGRMEVTRDGYTETFTVTGGQAIYTKQMGGSARAEEETYTAAWYDSTGALVDYGVFMIHMEPAGMKPWPAYAQGWNAVPSSRVKYENGCEDVGVVLSYTESSGIFHTGYSPEAAITGEPGAIRLSVEAPEGAACYRINHSGGNIIMGEDPWSVESQISFTAEQELEFLPEASAGQKRMVELADFVPLHSVQAGPLTVYVSYDSLAQLPYAGGVYSIFWYKDAETAQNNAREPFLIEYVADTTEPLCLTTEVPVVDQITKPVEEVTCVGDYNSEGWRLVVRRYPYKGENAFHYELTMENQYGAYQPLTQPMTFYMPYPKDYGNHRYTYSLRHYDEEYASSEELTVTEEEYGLKFVVRSLSPFVLEYREDSQGGDTGNDAPNVIQVSKVDMTTGAQVVLDGVWVNTVNIVFGGNRGETILILQNGARIDRLYLDEQSAEAFDLNAWIAYENEENIRVIYLGDTEYSFAEYVRQPSGN